MNCSFCGKDIPRGTEMIFVNKRGKALYFCSSKCDKNLIKLGRKPRETKWTAAYREEKVIRTKGGLVLAVKDESIVSKPVEKVAVAIVDKKPVAPKKVKESKDSKKEPKKEAKKKK